MPVGVRERGEAGGQARLLRQMGAALLATKSPIRQEAERKPSRPPAGAA